MIKDEHINAAAILLLAISLLVYMKTGGTSISLIKDISKSIILSMSFILIIRAFGVKIAE